MVCNTYILYVIIMDVLENIILKYFNNDIFTRNIYFNKITYSKSNIDLFLETQSNFVFLLDSIERLLCLYLSKIKNRETFIDILANENKNYSYKEINNISKINSYIYFLNEHNIKENFNDVDKFSNYFSKISELPDNKLKYILGFFYLYLQKICLEFNEYLKKCNINCDLFSYEINNKNYLKFFDLTDIQNEEILIEASQIVYRLLTDYYTYIFYKYYFAKKVKIV